MTLPSVAGTTTAPALSTAPAERAEPRIPRHQRRRSFTADYKLQVLAAYDAADPGEKGAILSREGLYSSHIVNWRRARDAGAFAALARSRGRPAADPRDAQIAQLHRQKARLERELAKVRLVVTVQTTTTRALGDALGGSGHRPEADTVINQAVAALAPWIGTRAACAAVGEPQASYYRRKRVSLSARPAPIPQAGSCGAVHPPGRARGEPPAGQPAAALW